MSKNKESHFNPISNENAIHVPRNHDTNDNDDDDADIGIIEIKPGMYHITNSAKYRMYLSSLDENKNDGKP